MNSHQPALIAGESIAMSDIKERPILFSGEMVRAILDGRKTRTRRVMKPQPVFHQPVTWEPTGSIIPSYWTWRRSQTHDILMHEHAPHQPDILEWCPYGKAGDRLWVRETWLYVGPGSGSELPYAIDETKDPANHIREHVWYRATKSDDSLRWKPSIFMPRWASRILLEVTGVRVERVQDISETDAVAEGYPAGCGIPPLDWYADLWDTINAKRGHGWKFNPFVWVVEFKRIIPQ